MKGTTDWVQLKTPLRLTCEDGVELLLAHLATTLPSRTLTSWASRTMPALLIRTSTRPKLGVHGPGGLDGAGGLAHVDGVEHGDAAGGGDRLDGVLACLFGHVPDRDGVAVLGEEEGGGAADAVAAAGDDGDAGGALFLSWRGGRVDRCGPEERAGPRFCAPARAACRAAGVP
jgi:hypothetical protein